MLRLISMALLALNTHTAEYLPSFVCQSQALGVSQAVSLALGQGHNADSWIEGSLVNDLHFSRDTAENVVNTLHSVLFNPIDKQDVIFADTGDCIER